MIRDSVSSAIQESRRCSIDLKRSADRPCISRAPCGRDRSLARPFRNWRTGPRARTSFRRHWARARELGDTRLLPPASRDRRSEILGPEQRAQWQGPVPGPARARPPLRNGELVGPLGLEPRTKGFTRPRRFRREWTISSPRWGAGRSCLSLSATQALR
jgi:hypothetical protein